MITGGERSILLDIAIIMIVMLVIAETVIIFNLTN